MKASGVEVDHTELDDLCQDLTERRDRYETEFTEASSSKTAKLNEDRKAAEEVRLVAVERLSETNKRKQESSDTDETSPQQQQKQKRRNNRSSGGDTIAFLREKSEREFQLREREMELRQQELEVNRLREQNAQLQSQQLLQGGVSLFELITKLTDKLS